ncbi:MAG: outer membrane protein assembly factor BamA [Ruminobacter sp.]|uniref:outer membrane protein assembly factor BamA n=1 Tax=Ruminobacter sp. TaxID=2774296 RepID=UPI001B6CEA76|nr:outer membrane protein assembly factor BamA [Ruminobacter sp.]MBP3749379.1 outer membrane protein assembly factor BamA [Ruminobacter sp.]
MFNSFLKRSLLAVCIANPFFYCSSALAEAKAESTEPVMQVTDIRVKGLYRVTKGAVLLAMPIQVGDTVTKDDISVSLKKIYATHNFDVVDAYINEDGVLTIDVKERPTIVNLTFAGNDAIKTEQITEIITSQGVKVGETLNVIKLKELEASLEDYYHSMGRYQAKVNTILVYLPRNRVDVKFNFVEGVNAKIEQINIVGNRVFPEEKLLGQFELRDSVPWWNFIASRNFYSQRFNGDLETLRSYYMNRGYVRFNVESTRVEVTPDRKGVYVSIAVKEGEQYKLNNFRVIGETYGHSEEMERIIPLEKGDIYNAAQVSHTEEILANYMGKYGYAYTKVRAITDVDDENRIVNVNFHVEPGRRIYVSNVRIVGNSITIDEVIRREIRQMDGTWLSNEAINVSKNRLNQLGFFDSVEVEPKKTGMDPDSVELVTTVKERPTGSIKAGVGFGTETGLTLNGEISQDNFMGYGGKATLAVNTNKYDRKVELSYDEPYFTIDGVSLGENIFYEKFEAGDANLVDYTNIRWGGGLNIGYPLNENNYIRYGLTYINNKLSQTNSFVQIQKFWDMYADNSTTNHVVFQNYVGSITYVRNYLDRGVFPTDGNKQWTNLSVAVPGSDTQYYKASADTTHFWPIDKEHNYIVNFRAMAGYGNGYGRKHGFEQVLPFFENFYLGGDEWLRGFKYNSVGPRALYDYTLLGNNGVVATRDVVGGNAMVAGSLQLVVPTPFASEGYDTKLRTTLFVDAGSLWDTTFDKDYVKQCLGNCEYMYDFSDPDNFRVSYGMSLVWMSPMGPIGFTLANPIKKKKGDRTEFFSFTLGRTF